MHSFHRISWLPIVIGFCVLVLITSLAVLMRNPFDQESLATQEQTASSTADSVDTRGKRGASGSENPLKVSKLTVDLSTITPQYVNDQEAEGVTLPANISKIKEEMRAIISPKSTDDKTSEFYRVFKLRAVGNRYVVYEDFPMKMVQSTADIFDTQSNKIIGKLLYPPALLTSDGLEIHASSSDNSLCVYRLDTPTCEYLTNSLSDKGIYNKSTGADVGGVEFDVIQHADSFTIGLYEWKGGVPVKVGERTFDLPKK